MYTEVDIRMDSIKQTEINEIKHKLMSLRDALINCQSQDIFKAIAKSSSNFIYELIQNADDAKAREVRFEILDNMIVVSNNGNKLVESDILRLCGVNQDKERNNLIGRFGVGFKIVYNISKRVDVYSNGYYFGIENFIDLNPLGKGKKEYCDDNTHFVLHLFENSNEFESITGSNGYNYKKVSEIVNEIRKIKTEDLIFLNNIKKIEIVHKNEVIFSFNSDIEPEDGNIIVVNEKDRFLMFEDESNKNKAENKFIKVAYRLNSSNEIIPAFDNITTKLYSFFPLNSIDTKMKFFMQAKFSTNIERTNIDFSIERNKQVLNELAELISRSVKEIIKKGFKINYSLFLFKAQKDTGNLFIYNQVRNSLIDMFMSGDILLAA